MGTTTNGRNNEDKQVGQSAPLWKSRSVVHKQDASTVTETRQGKQERVKRNKKASESS
jgi:hypothetical protein